MKYADYFYLSSARPDRNWIKLEWIEYTFAHPLKEIIQADGRIQRWAWIEEVERYLRIVVLPDRETIFNAFFDRRFTP